MLSPTKSHATAALHTRVQQAGTRRRWCWVDYFFITPCDALNQHQHPRLLSRPFTPKKTISFIHFNRWLVRFIPARLASGITGAAALVMVSKWSEPRCYGAGYSCVSHCLTTHRARSCLLLVGPTVPGKVEQGGTARGVRIMTYGLLSFGVWNPTGHLSNFRS